jgi:opacity protein-like surface antigen
MKTTVLAFVLVTALAAGAQDATPQQPQPAAPPASGQQPAAGQQQAAGQQPAGQPSTAAP